MKYSGSFLSAVCIALSCIAITYAADVTNSTISCASGVNGGNFTYLRFNDGCKDSKNCTFVVGKSYTGYFGFVANKNYTGVRLNMTTLQDGKKIGSGQVGLVKKNQPVEIKYDFKFDNATFFNRTGKTVVKFLLNEDKAPGAEVICRLLTVNVKNGASGIIGFSFLALIFQQTMIHLSK